MSTTSVPQLRKSSLGPMDYSKPLQWLREHRHEHLGQWVVLDGDRLVGAGSDPTPIVTQARAEGVNVPFVKFITEDEEQPFTGGWL